MFKVIDNIKIINEVKNTTITNFINTENEYYKKNILCEKKYSDGYYYDGYLWDCVKNVILISENELIGKIKYKCNYYIFWDKHSNDKIKVSNYWKFGKHNIVYCTGNEYINNIKLFPEDIYILNENFCELLIFTHETNLDNSRYCLYSCLMQDK